MSDEESGTVDTSEEQRLTVEYKDGHLQIVEVTTYEQDKTKMILPDVISVDAESGQNHKYMQVLDPEKGLVQLDLLNLTLVRCDDGEESYRLVTNADTSSGEIPVDGSVACVLHSSDGEDHDGQESYVIVEGDQVPYVFLQSALSPGGEGAHAQVAEAQPAHAPAPAHSHARPSQKKLSPSELLEKAKALQKAKNFNCYTRIGKRGRRRKGELPPPHELLASPDFKLFLYSCKLCNFKCNAIKELAAHRSASHGGGRGRITRQPSASLQCARCPFRGATSMQLMKHINTNHLEGVPQVTTTNKVSLDSKEVEEADVLVCGACGFESGNRAEFKAHIEDEHGATTT